MNWLRSYLYNPFLRPFFTSNQFYFTIQKKEELTKSVVWSTTAILTFFAFKNLFFGSFFDWTAFRIILEISLLLFCLGFFLFNAHISQKNNYFRRFFPILIYLATALFSLVNQFFIVGRMSFFFFDILEKILLIFLLGIFFILNRDYLATFFKPHFVRNSWFISVLLLIILSKLFVPKLLTYEPAANQQYIQNLLDISPFWNKFFFNIEIILFGPLFEELLIRYLAFRLFFHHTKLFFLFSIIWFAVPHVHYPDFFNSEGNFSIFSLINKTAWYWRSGIVSAIIYWTSGYQIFYPLLFHIFNNFSASI